MPSPAHGSNSSLLLADRGPGACSATRTRSAAHLRFYRRRSGVRNNGLVDPPIPEFYQLLRTVEAPRSASIVLRKALSATPTAVVHHFLAYVAQAARWTAAPPESTPPAPSASD
jgi:hypothetical protein